MSWWQKLRRLPERHRETTARRGPAEPRDAPFSLEVVGESFYQAELAALAGGHNRHGHYFDCSARLICDPDNEHDPNAVRVEIDGRTVGYLTRAHAARYRAGLQKHGREGEIIKCDGQIVGGWRTNQHDAGHFGVRLRRPWPLSRSQAPPA